MKELYGIDVSSNNGTLNWDKAPDFSFVIMRITQRYGIDRTFEHNYEGVTKRGFKRGVYRVSYAKTAEESKKEAEEVISVLNERRLEFPIFLDLEWEEQMKFSKERISEIVEAFRNVVLKAGYKFGIYTGTYFYNQLISDEIKAKNDFWIAAYPDNDTGEIVERLRPSIGIGWQYSCKKMIDGFGGPFDADVFYTDYSEIKEDKHMGITAKDVIQVAKSWIGKNEADGSHKAIIDIYNSHKPLARGYKVKYTDQWCDTTVSAIFISLSAVDAIGGTECGVEEHVKLFKIAGIWMEDGSMKPEPGDIIVYNWDDLTQPNNGYSDHIGIVEKCTGATITTIEGNYKDAVGRRQIPVGWGYIRGYARPKYSTATETVKKPTTQTAKTPAKSPAATTPVKAASSHKTVALNSYGEDVRELQRDLNALGYTLAVDGKFGMRTYAAVRNYQSKKNLGVDGICGPITWASIDKDLSGSSKLKSIGEVAKEVIDGKWGNQPNRKKNLEAAGYNYDEVQKEVNRLLAK